MVERLTNEQLQARADSETNAHVQAAFIELIQRRKLEEEMTLGTGIEDIARKLKDAVAMIQTQEGPGLMDNPLRVLVEIDGDPIYLDAGINATDLESAVFALATVRGQLNHVAQQVAELQKQQEEKFDD